MFDVGLTRKDFPILDQAVFGHRLVYLDNAATTQMPEPVLECLCQHYHADNANVHRGIHALSERSTRAFEEARETVRAFVNAASADEVIFTSGTTGSINMLADMWQARVRPGSCIVSTMMEHHANFVPWQQLCKRIGARFMVAPLTPEGDLDLKALQSILERNTVSLVTVAHVSNVLGTVNPVKEIARMAHEQGALCAVDAAQSIRHEGVDVRYLDCDFMAFSGHKMCGPTGIGVLYGKKALLEQFNPVRFGGEMVDTVRSGRTTFAAPPLRFEAGTPNYIGARGLAAAIDYLNSLGMQNISSYEHELVRYAESKLSHIEGLTILGSPAIRAGCLSFSIEGAHPFDIASLTDKLGIALRSGNQCAQPLLCEDRDVRYVTRLSPAFYNTFAEIDAAVEALETVASLIQSTRG